MAYINVDEVYILDNTGLQVDMATDIPFVDAGFTDTQKAQARANIGAGGTNPNLLNNPFFTIRQRGDGPFTGNVYGVDRWRGSNSRTTVTGQSGYITLSTTSAGNGLLRQILSQTYEGTYTFGAIVKGSGSGAIALQDSGGNFIGTTEEFTVSGEELLVKTTFTTSGTPIGGVVIRVDTGNSIDVVAAKLEVGSVSTLANDTPPNYAEELAKCRYYFRRIKASAAANVLIGATTSTTAAVFVVPDEMYPNTGSISKNGTITANTKSVTAVSQVLTSEGVTITATSSGLTANNGAVLNLASGAYIDISHEL